MPLYNNPGFQQGVENLAKLFAPPSGAEAAGWAAANAKNAEARRQAEFYAKATAPGASHSLIDQYGVAAGAMLPTQTYHAVDVESGDRRYGVDVGAKTELQKLYVGDATARRGQEMTTEASRANNQADNARALDQTRVQQQGELARLYAAPIKLGQGETAILPRQAAEATGLDPRLSGAPKPMSETEVMGAERQDLRQRGLLTDRDLIDTILGDKAPVQAIGPDGKTATYMSPGQAVRTGAQPYVKPTNETMSPLARLMQERDALPQGDPRRGAYDQNIAALGRGQQQSAYDRTNDENLAKLNSEIYQGAVGAVGDRNTLGRLRQAVASPDAPQGALAGTNLAVRKLLNTFGVDAGDTSEAEMIAALGNTLALRLRDPSNGAGMPGSLSDSDRNFLQSMAVSLGNSPEANRKLVDYYLRVQQKNLDLEGLRRDYVTKNGRVDEGFRAAVGDYLRQSGIYATGGAGGATGAGGTATPATISDNEGTVATNPTTGAKLILRNGQWEPVR